MTTEQKPTYEELKALAAKALAEGNDAEFIRISKAVLAFKADIAKAEAEALKKEAELLAGDRQALASRINGQVSKFAWLVDALEKVKANGFVFHKPGYVEADGSTTVNATVGLIVPTVKVRKTGGGGGGAGKTSKDEFGKSLDELYKEFKDAVGPIKVLKSEGTADALMEIAGDNNTKQWQVKTAVKKAAIAKGLLKPVA